MCWRRKENGEGEERQQGMEAGNFESGKVQIVGVLSFSFSCLFSMDHWCFAETGQHTTGEEGEKRFLKWLTNTEGGEPCCDRCDWSHVGEIGNVVNASIQLQGKLTLCLIRFSTQRDNYSACESKHLKSRDVLTKDKKYVYIKQQF